MKIINKILISLILGFASFLTIDFFNSQMCVIYKFDEVKETIRSIDMMFKMFKSNYGVNPPSGNWQNELLGNNKATINTRKNCYIVSTKDSWGNEIRAVIPGKYNKSGVDVFSVGADGISKTNGNDPDDLNNWSPSHDGQYYHRKFARERIYSFILQGVFCSLVALVFILYGLKTTTKNAYCKTNGGYLIFEKSSSAWVYDKDNKTKWSSILPVIAGFLIVFILAAALDYPPFAFDTGSECPAFLVTLIYSISVFFLRFRIKTTRYTALTLAIFSFVMFAERVYHYTMR